MRYELGQKVMMSKDALENYGKEHKGKVLTIIHAAHSYMPAKEFYANGRPQGYHPGYDNAVKGQGLYDFLEFESSLYDWELKPV